MSGAVARSIESSLPAGSARLARHFLSTGKLGESALERAAQVASESEAPFETVLHQLGLVPEDELVQAIAAVASVAILSDTDLPKRALLQGELRASFLREVRALPVGMHNGRPQVAMVNPLDERAVAALRFAIERPIDLIAISPSRFEKLFEKLYGAATDARSTQPAGSAAHIADDVDRLSDLSSDAPVIRLVNALIAGAVEAGASDIHIEPMESELYVRYRIDGILQRIDAPPRSLAAAILSRIKVMAKLNIAERRLAQDGRIGVAVQGRDIDLRVATTPTVHGESAVLRILDRGQRVVSLSALGFDSELEGQVRSLTNKPHGIVLVTGPTGSGKTTTLYAVLDELNTTERKILTIEDPVEYQLDGVNQVQVKPQIGLTFANALRSFLRNDPDIMMIGEIRDLESARIAAQAALTGHLILATLHTNDAPSAVTRLIDMGLEDYLLTATLNGVVAQRLVRSLCKTCRQSFEPDAQLIAGLNLLQLSGGSPILHRAVGCPDCRGTGYRGRTAIIEVLALTDELRRAITKDAPASEVARLAQASGMETLRTHGIRKALAGVTTIDEVLRVTLEAA
ncbi:MAG: Flp pilus assembly complex ATPase component TadA [Alphaproteobacteria bacterium]|nr:Flp pilus assembly complex ATPase component TadA [Alphaproteobacteria bacterium]MBL6938548.1 Flp pilus assembly complex ATPase component TadA [Alphaproteobacteria bacterium]MBL7096607.1 Flp pilus assembly complex ATPase component TadA [Alphaproteobacteria bacterium]